MALKLLYLLLASNEEVQHFQLEARILALLRHRHIVVIHDFGFELGTPFMVMDYASGGNLQQHFERYFLAPLALLYDGFSLDVV